MKLENNKSLNFIANKKLMITDAVNKAFVSTEEQFLEYVRALLQI